MEISIYRVPNGWHVVVHGAGYQTLVNTIVPDSDLQLLPETFPPRPEISALFSALQTQHWRKHA